MDFDEQEQSSESEGYQLRFRISNLQRIAIENLRVEKFKGETLSDIVRSALSRLVKSPDGTANTELEKKLKPLPLFSNASLVKLNKPV